MSAIASRHRQLLDDVKRNIAVLEDSISHIVDTKRNLKTSALEVKGQIHSCISRQLEALRNREVWLLNQVETIQHAKEDALRLQLGKLNQTLGSFKNCAAYTKLYLDGLSDEVDPKVIETQLMENLNSLAHLKLTPKENASICFRANRGKLREMIHDFGRVDSRSISVNQERAFTDPTFPSTSLPSPFEDYEDLDHHVLYKTLAELKEQKQKVTFPEVSEEHDDWLIKVPTNTPAETIPSIVFPTFKDATPTTSSVGMTAKKKTDEVEKWLHHVPTGYHGTPSTMEDDFSIMDQSRSVSDIISASVIEDKDETFFDMSPYFKYISNSPNDEWLLNSDRIKATYNYGKDYPYATMKYFREISKDTKDWLMEYEAQKDDSIRCEKMNCESGEHCAALNQTKQDIESLGNISCISQVMGRYFKEIPSDPKMWLADQLENSCVANEKCDHPSQCVSDTHCLGTEFNQSDTSYNPILDWYKTASNEVSDWLLPNSNAAMHDTANSPILEYFRMISASDISDWLHVPSVSSTNQLNLIKSPFEEYLQSVPQNISFWLSECHRKNSKSGPASFKFDWDSFHSDCNQWVKPSLIQGVTTQAASNKKENDVLWEKLGAFHREMNQSDWLLEQDDEKMDKCVEFVDSDFSETFPPGDCDLNKWLLIDPTMEIAEECETLSICGRTVEIDMPPQSQNTFPCFNQEIKSHMWLLNYTK
ncbi:nuclear receptor coactivator 4-like [Saccoglossus kowalevskii]|uniref:Nuclear receptor coactivator 4-like n=1 Tax=Saccoglossus kowalevskii TaxID=10224 RepID=A0ABM0MZD5_SACKO|nr:PREDICTED: nuclear receptor coactivator 4-like [Saccoglossus kowalevskii]